MAQDGSEGVPGVHVGGPVGGHDHHPLPGERTHEEDKEVEGRSVGPLEILDDHQHRRLFREPAEQVEHRLEHPGTGEMIERGDGLRFSEERRQAGKGGESGAATHEGRAVPAAVGDYRAQRRGLPVSGCCRHGWRRSGARYRRESRSGHADSQHLISADPFNRQ